MVEYEDAGKQARHFPVEVGELLGGWFGFIGTKQRKQRATVKDIQAATAKAINWICIERNHTGWLEKRPR